MCCCDKPTINGEMGFKWQPKDPPRRFPVNAPTLHPHDVLLYDEPGRCGGLDAHSHHYCLVQRYSSVLLLVRHGAGEDELRISRTKTLMDHLEGMETNARYWFFHAVYHAYQDGVLKAQKDADQRWRKAAAEKRIKTRKVRGEDAVKVWITEK